MLRRRLSLGAASVSLGCLATACRAWRVYLVPPRQIVSITVVAVTQAVVRPPPTPDCTPLAPGMAITATVQSSGVVVEVAGLQPGEVPHFDYAHNDPGQAPEHFAITPGQTVGADGRAVDASFLRTAAIGDSPEHWEVRVVHAQGVACAQFTLP